MSNGRKKVLSDSVFSQKVQLITESAWYSVLLDFAGIVDPTGGIDFLRSMYFFKKGDYFNSLMYLLSAIPMADFVTKPLISLSKYSGPAQKLKDAINMHKTNPVQSQKLLSEILEDPGDVGKFMRSVRDWAPLFFDKLSAGPLKSEMGKTMLDLVNFIFEKPRLVKTTVNIVTPDKDKVKTTVEPKITSYSGIDSVNINDDPLSKMFGNLFSGNFT